MYLNDSDVLNVSEAEQERTERDQHAQQGLALGSGARPVRHARASGALKRGDLAEDTVQVVAGSVSC